MKDETVAVELTPAEATYLRLLLLGDMGEAGSFLRKTPRSEAPSMRKMAQEDLTRARGIYNKLTPGKPFREAKDS